MPDSAVQLLEQSAGTSAQSTGPLELRQARALYLAKQLKSALAEAGLSKEELAEIIKTSGGECSLSTIYAMASEKRALGDKPLDPSFSKVAEVAAALGKSLDYFREAEEVDNLLAALAKLRAAKALDVVLKFEGLTPARLRMLGGIADMLREEQGLGARPEAGD